MARSRGLFCLIAIIFPVLPVLSWSQANQPASPKPATSATSPAPSSPGKDPSQESVVFERISHHLVFDADGSGTQDSTVVARIQSQAGVQDMAVLSFAYTSYNQTVDVDYVRVKKPDGTIVVTPDYNIQDMPGDVTRRAPMYSDIHEKHVTVKALGVGDVLEYKLRYRTTKPQIPGQFWFQYSFMKLYIAKDEELVISVPRDKYVKIESPDYQPQVKEEGALKTYTWKTANLTLKDRDELLKKREAPKPFVQITTFRDWGEVARWYEELQRPQMAITPQIQAKVVELTKGMASDDDKIRAIYNFVSLHFHYVSLSFGVGRYQPHAAEECWKTSMATAKTSTRCWLRS
jgi:hypothetical protein